MTSATASPTEAPVQPLLERLRAVPPPRPVLDRDRERRLTDRQRELLDALSRLFDGGFVHLTMAEIAARLNCSLRTLYALAPSRDELVLVVTDRNLWRIGRSARDAIRPGMAPLDALQAYLRAANVAVSDRTEAFARDITATPAAEELGRRHAEYLVAVTHALLDLAVERGDIAPVDTAALARIMAGLAPELARPEVAATLGSAPVAAADAVLDVIVRGLVAPRRPAPPTKGALP